MIGVAPSAMSTSSARHRGRRADAGTDQGDLAAAVVDDADRVVAVLERHVVPGASPTVRVGDDVAEPAHTARSGSPAAGGGSTG